MMKAVFAVLDRKLMDGLAAELKRDIYEEIYAPTPEPQTCDACGKMFPADQITELNGRKLHADCYYAAVNANNAEMAAIADEIHKSMLNTRERVLYYKAQGLSVRKIADALKTEGITMSKSAVDRILQESKEAQA